jgi:prevent-host-death family protein
MDSVGAFEAKTHLAALLERVAQGETIEITRRGVPVARLVPATSASGGDPRKLAAEIRRLRKGNRLEGVKIRDLIEKGRRF